MQWLQSAGLMNVAVNGTIIPMSVKRTLLYANPDPAIQQQKPLSNPRFGVFEADVHMRLLILRSVFFTDTGRII